MQQGWSARATRVALIVGLAASCAAGFVEVRPASARAGASGTPDLRQFTGTVTAMDQASLTVEKRGKQARTMVFARHAGMKTQGDVDRNVRVTVYYRDENGKPTAHRVVVKPARTRAANGGR